MSGAGSIGSGAGEMITSNQNAHEGEYAANTGSHIQQDFGEQAMDLQGREEQYARDLYHPYIQGGEQAQGQIDQGMGPNGSLARSFAQTDFHQDPGYQFNIDQGLKAIGNSNSVRGGALSGGTLRALSNYGQEQASNEYGQAYSRFTTNQDRNFNKLNTVAQRGAGASESLGQLGVNYSAQGTSELNSIGNSLAAGVIGASKARQAGNTGTMHGLTTMGNGIMSSFSS